MWKMEKEGKRKSGDEQEDDEAKNKIINGCHGDSHDKCDTDMDSQC